MQATGKVSPTLTAALKDVGVSVFDAQSKLRPMNDILGDVADSFSKMPDGTEKTALATKIFGRAGAELIPILDQGRAGLGHLQEEMKKSGAMMSGPQVEAAHRAFQAHEKLEMMIDGVKTQIGSAMLPVLERLNTTFADAIPKIEAVVGAIGKFVDFLVDKATPYVREFAEKHRAQFEQIATKVEAIMHKIAAIVGPILRQLGAWWQAHGDQVMHIVGDAFTAIWDVINTVITAIADVINLFLDALSGNWSGVWNDINNLVGDVMGGIGRTINDALDGLPGQVFTKAVAIGHAIVQGITSALAGLAGAIRGAVESAVPGGAEGPLGGALHALGLAGGGVVTRPTLALIGEAGPEAVVPLSGSLVSPMGRGGLGGPVVNMDFRGSYFTSQRAFDDLKEHSTGSSFRRWSRRPGSTFGAEPRRPPRSPARRGQTPRASGTPPRSLHQPKPISHAKAKTNDLVLC